MSGQKRYRIYIDESGDHTYSDLEKSEKRYLGLTGCFFELDNIYDLFKQQLEELKKKYFTYDPDLPIIFHRKEMINRKGVFGKLCNDEIREHFDNDFLVLLKHTDFKIITVVIDKQSHQKRYGDAAFHPYHYCLASILERYCGYLNYIGAKGDVMAESRGGTEDMQLKEAYKQVYEKGTSYREKVFFSSVLTSNEIKLKPKSANIAGIQLADMLAYSIKHEILVAHNHVTKTVADTFGQRICKAVENKHNKREDTNKVDGYGKIFIK